MNLFSLELGFLKHASFIILEITYMILGSMYSIITFYCFLFDVDKKYLSQFFK